MKNQKELSTRVKLKLADSLINLLHNKTLAKIFCYSMGFFLYF